MIITVGDMNAKMSNYESQSIKQRSLVFVRFLSWIANFIFSFIGQLDF